MYGANPYPHNMRGIIRAVVIMRMSNTHYRLFRNPSYERWSAVGKSELGKEIILTTDFRVPWQNNIV